MEFGHPGPGSSHLVCSQAASHLGQLYVECAQVQPQCWVTQSPGLSDPSKSRRAGCVEHTLCWQPTRLCPALDISASILPLAH